MRRRKEKNENEHGGDGDFSKESAEERQGKVANG
jgi:hypothetical protein